MASISAISCDIAEYNDEESQDSPFLHLPEEMFLYICSYLDVTDIVVSLSRVCRKFYFILQSQNIWKSWIAERWGRHYPIIKVDDECVNWKEACYSLEKDSKAWTGNLRKIVVEEGHMSDVHAVLFCLEGAKCITASRDRHIGIWSVYKDSPRMERKIYAHEGWIWRLKKVGDTIYSASWDNTIKLWSLDIDLVEKQQVRCDSAVLCVEAEDNGVFYGGCFRRVYAFDPRVQVEPLFTLESSSQAVLTLDLLGDDLISGSENKTITVWDKKTRSLRQTLKLPVTTYPVCSQMFDGVLYVGDREGKVRLYTMNSGALAEAAVVNLGNTKPVVAINVSAGSIITGCDRSVKVSLPLKPTFPLAEFNSQGGLVSGMDCSNGHLAIGTATTVEFWLPQH